MNAKVTLTLTPHELEIIVAALDYYRKGPSRGEEKVKPPEYFGSPSNSVFVANEMMSKIGIKK